MLAKVGTLAVGLGVGLVAGFVVGGGEVSELGSAQSAADAKAPATETTAAAQPERIGVDEAVAKALLMLSDRLESQRARLDANAAAIDKLVEASVTEQELAAQIEALSECGRVRVAVEKDLEACLFESQQLAKAAAAGRNKQGDAMSGRAAVETTVSYPVPNEGTAGSPAASSPN